jgi:uncharacterized membrane protein
VTKYPHFGHTRTGKPVHQHTHDYHAAGSAYARFNKKVAIVLTNSVGTMTTFWLFCLWSLLSLPAVLSAFGPFTHVFPGWMVKASIIALVAWVAQTFIQLVLLPALMVGQNLQNQAADARASKQFEDTETIADRVDLETEGGIKVLNDKLDKILKLLGKEKL